MFNNSLRTPIVVLTINIIAVKILHLKWDRRTVETEVTGI